MTAQEFINMAMRNIGPICGPNLHADLQAYIAEQNRKEAYQNAYGPRDPSAVSFVKRDGVWEMPR